MTTVDRYRSSKLVLPSDVPTNGRRNHSPSTTIAKKSVIPPAVPSPPEQSYQHSPPRKPNIEPDYNPPLTMTSEETSQWYFTDAELAATPSVADGLPILEEKTRRAKAVNFIIQAGILLKLPQLTLATASVFLHRFYMRYSMVPEKNGLHHYVWLSRPSSLRSYKPPSQNLPRSKSHADLRSKAVGNKPLTFESLEQNIAATSLFLATKTEENCRKTKEIVIAVAKVAQKNASLIIDEQSKEYWRWRDNILLYEELMLEYLTFDVVLQSPYNFLYDCLQKLQVEDNKPLRNVAWAFLNDSCLTMICLMMPPKDIAAAAIYFAAKGTQNQIPDDENGAPWWEQIGGKADLITKAVGVMNDFYTENPLKRTDNPYEQSPASGNEDDLERTRGRGYSNAQTPNDDGARSQRSQNGHAQRERTPVINGNGTANHVSQLTENGKPASPPSQATRSETTAVASQLVEPSGSSDAALKAAANDPATHERPGHTNGDSFLTNQTSQADASTKRREADPAEEPAAKKLKNDSGGESAPMVMSEASEEGELDE
jgi:protein BUR2